MNNSVKTQQNILSLIEFLDNLQTLKVFPTYKAGIDIDVGKRDGAEFLKVEVQHTPGR